MTQPILLLVLALLLLLFSAVAALALWLYRELRGRRAESVLPLTLLQQQVESLRSQVSESLSRSADLTQNRIGEMAREVAQNLQASAGQIHSRLDSYSQVVQNVSTQLGSLEQATQRIFETTKNIASLEEILKPPKLRGAMGEILLGNILREILPSEEFFSLQYSFRTGNTVDAVIHLKDGLIPIDAKFPLDNFRRMSELPDEKERDQARREFNRNIRKHIDDISSKYILPDEGTMNFALMYLPAENVYYETIVRSGGTEPGDDLYAYSTRKHVFPVSPNSLYPYLMTLALGFRGLKIESQAREILSELGRLHGDLEKFNEDFETVGGHIANAQKKFADASKKLDRMDQKLQSLKEGLPEAPRIGPP
ncbi:MAG: hypothetical protein A2902_02205 [Elusimicrobia bacterium RIFCSPLOWO2_01_FULL_64_13]|nr:MAG: hypothetical protein A2636_02775 [Elusimicrobia bacterium RIFCSPHIGHO2_01_FULL_64_10]OGR94365.1 MAG: hypothetical protein A2902_02205 [Elusimicrobia bacterium RIFCSPLOWO2_01_FULL_64_13]